MLLMVDALKSVTIYVQDASHCVHLDFTWPDPITSLWGQVSFRLSGLLKWHKACNLHHRMSLQTFATQVMMVCSKSWIAAKAGH